MFYYRITSTVGWELYEFIDSVFSSKNSSGVYYILCTLLHELQFTWIICGKKLQLKDVFSSVMWATAD